MKRSEESPDERSITRIRSGATIAGIVVMLLIAFLWFQSYFTATSWYHSTWRKTAEPDGVTERANWLMSNYGSFGIAWRRQEGAMQEALPESARELTRLPASRSALGHIHPEGIAAWHWIKRSSNPPAMAGSIRHYYGDLFIPYWIPFLLFLVLVVSMNVRHDDREQGGSLISEPDGGDKEEAASRRPLDDTSPKQDSGES